jgi:hypothetical protein
MAGSMTTCRLCPLRFGHRLPLCPERIVSHCRFMRRSKDHRRSRGFIVRLPVNRVTTAAAAASVHCWHSRARKANPCAPHLAAESIHIRAYHKPTSHNSYYRYESKSQCNDKGQAQFTAWPHGRMHELMSYRTQRSERAQPLAQTQVVLLDHRSCDHRRLDRQTRQGRSRHVEQTMQNTA